MKHYRMADFPDLKGPDAKAILELHRGLDAYVRFFRKLPGTGGGSLTPFQSVRVGDLEAWFPQFIEDLWNDSYMSINSFWRAGTTQTRDLRYLNAAYADLDAYDLGEGAAFEAIQKMQDAKIIPPASILGRSGRGLWCFWMLRDSVDETQPVHAFAEKREWYLRIQSAINHRIAEALPELRPDVNAVDASRLTRIPGSIHSTVVRAVTWLMQLDAAGRRFMYTLDDLGEWFGERPNQPLPQSFHRTKNRSVAPARNRGYRAMHEHRINDLRLLSAYRCGLPDGMRNRAALAMAHSLVCLKMNDDDVMEALTEFTDAMRPPLSSEEVKNVLTDARRRPRSMSALKLSEWFDVSVEEASHLDLVQIRPDRAPTYDRANPKGRNRQRELRRAVLQAIVHELGRVPPVREVQRRMKDFTPSVEAAIRTLLLDMVALGIRSGRERPHVDDFSAPMLFHPQIDQTDRGVALSVYARSIHGLGNEVFGEERNEK